MKNKIKEAVYSFIIIMLIAFLGLAPIRQKEVHSSIGWNDLGKKMIEAGVIDQEKFERIYEERGGLSEEAHKLLSGVKNKNLVIIEENSGAVLNLLWAFGLSNKNPILEKGPMMDPRYGGAYNFASTSGWTLAKGGAMDHYSMHNWITLTEKEQALVEKTSKNIFRPCCKNPAYFPDCNHGMAMLGLLEIMASEGANEDEMYKMAEEVNNLWFPKIRTGCGV